MNSYRTDVGAIRKKMKEKKIKTILELSNVSGIGRRTLSKVLNEEVQPSSDTMEKLIFCLDITPEEAGSIFLNKYYLVRKIIRVDLLKKYG